MSEAEQPYRQRIMPRLLIILIVSALYVIDIRTFTADVISQLTGFPVEGRVLMISGNSRIMRVEWESSGLIGIAVLALLFLVTGDAIEFVLSTLIYFTLNLGLLLIVVYIPEAYIVFWFYSAFSIVIAYVLAYYLIALMKYKGNVEKPMPPPPSE